MLSLVKETRVKFLSYWKKVLFSIWDTLIYRKTPSPTCWQRGTVDNIAEHRLKPQKEKKETDTIPCQRNPVVLLILHLKEEEEEKAEKRQIVTDNQEYHIFRRGKWQ